MGVNEYEQIFELYQCFNVIFHRISFTRAFIYEMLIFYYCYELCSVVRFAIVPSYHRLI